ncbi:RING-type E3 ubiquitin transferase [Ranunculus cassubicifolius]
MNSTTEPRNVPAWQFHGIRYLFLFPVVIVLFIGISAVLGCYHRAMTQRQGNSTTEAESGLDETTLQKYPRFLYSQLKLDNKENISTCCSICLSDYKKLDMLRSLPNCGHVFHLNCVDPWLRLHPSCPVCRELPTPRPLHAPLSDDVPLAHHLV